MSLNLPPFPALPDTSSLPLPSVADVSEAVSDVIVTALDTAGDAATVVVASARRRPKVAIGVGVGGGACCSSLMFLRRRRHTRPRSSATEHDARIAASLAA